MEMDLQLFYMQLLFEHKLQQIDSSESKSLCIQKVDAGWIVLLFDLNFSQNDTPGKQIDR